MTASVEPRGTTGQRGEVVRAAGMLSAAGAAVGVGNLGFNVLMARIAGVEAYGSIGVLLGTATVAGFFATGVQYAITKDVALGRASARRLLSPTPATVRWAAMTVLGLAGMCVPLTAYLHLGSVAPAAFTMLLIGLMLLASVPTGIVVGQRRFAALACWQLVMVICRLLLGLLLGRLIDPTVAALCATAVSVVVLAVGLTSVALSDDDQPISMAQRRGLLGAETTMGALYSGGLWALWTVPLLVARHTLSADQAGDFAAAQVLSGSVLFLTTPIATAFFPSIAQSGPRRVLLAGLIATAAVAAGAGCVLVIAGPVVLDHVYAGSFRAPRMLFVGLGCSALVTSLLTYGLWSLRALGKLGPATLAAIGTALLGEMVLGATLPPQAELIAIAPVLASGGGLAVLTAVARPRRRSAASRALPGSPATR